MLSRQIYIEEEVTKYFFFKWKWEKEKNEHEIFLYLINCYEPKSEQYVLMKLIKN